MGITSKIAGAVLLSAFLSSCASLNADTPTSSGRSLSQSEQDRFLDLKRRVMDDSKNFSKFLSFKPIIASELQRSIHEEIKTNYIKLLQISLNDFLKDADSSYLKDPDNLVLKNLEPLEINGIFDRNTAESLITSQIYINNQLFFTDYFGINSNPAFKDLSRLSSELALVTFKKAMLFMSHNLQPPPKSSPESNLKFPNI